MAYHSDYPQGRLICLGQNYDACMQHLEREHRDTPFMISRKDQHTLEQLKSGLWLVTRKISWPEITKYIYQTRQACGLIHGIRSSSKLHGQKRTG